MITYASREYVTIPRTLSHLPIVSNSIKNQFPYASRWNYIKNNLEFNYWHRSQNGELFPCLITASDKKVYDGFGGFKLLTEDAPVKPFYSLQEISIVKLRTYVTGMAILNSKENTAQILCGISGVTPEEYPGQLAEVFTEDVNEFATYKAVKMN